MSKPITKGAVIMVRSKKMVVASILVTPYLLEYQFIKISFRSGDR